MRISRRFTVSVTPEDTAAEWPQEVKVPFSAATMIRPHELVIIFNQPPLRQEGNEEYDLLRVTAHGWRVLRNGKLSKTSLHDMTYSARGRELWPSWVTEAAERAAKAAGVALPGEN
jgi:hypothetical protein